MIIYLDMYLSLHVFATKPKRLVTPCNEIFFRALLELLPVKDVLLRTRRARQSIWIEVGHRQDPRLNMKKR